MTRGRVLGPGKLRKRDGNYVLDYTDEFGNRKRRALSHDKRTAERIRAEFIRRRDMALAGLGGEEGQSMLLTELRDQYLDDLEPRVKPRHFKNVAVKLTRVIESIQAKRVRDLRPMHAIRHRNSLLSDGRTPRTANLDVESLKAALNWAAENGLIASNPLRSLKKLPEGKGTEKQPRRALTDDEIERFLAASRADDEQCEILADDVRMPVTPLWRALLETGGRYGEIVKLTWADVDFERRVVALRAENTKSSKERLIPLSESLADELWNLRVLREQRFGRLATAAEPVFLSPEGCRWRWDTANLRRILHRVLKRAGIRRVTAEGKIDVHAMRHTFASRLARSSVELVHTQRLLGHSDPKLTAQVYTHLGIEDLREAIDGAVGSTPGEPRVTQPGPGYDRRRVR